MDHFVQSLPLELQDDVYAFCQEIMEVFRKYCDSSERFHEGYRKWLKTRYEVIDTLKSISAVIDKHHKNVNIACLSGSSVSLLSGGACLAGLALAPFTGGLSVVLTAGGLLGTSAGTLTVTGAQIAEYALKKQACDKAYSLLESDNKETLCLDSFIDNCLNDLRQILDLLHRSNCAEWIQRSEAISLEMIEDACLAKRIGRIKDGLGSVEDFLLVLSILLSDNSVFTRANFSKSFHVKPELLLHSTLKLGATLRSSVSNIRKCAVFIKNWKNGLSAVSVASKMSRISKGALMGISMIGDVAEIGCVAKDMICQKKTQESKSLQDIIMELKIQTDEVTEYYNISASGE